MHAGLTSAWEAVVSDSGLEIFADNCYSKDENINLDEADWVMIVILCLFGFTVAFSTLVDIGGNVFNVKQLKSSAWSQTLRGFSAYSNTVKIFSTGKISQDSLTCINGIRFLSMTWVLISHGYSQFGSSLPVNNLLYLADGKGPVYGNLAFQAILNGFPSVDSFFFIGATLLAFITLRELDKTNGGNVQFWIMYYVHRYIRLTGVYALVIGITATLIKFFAVGTYSILVEY